MKLAKGNSITAIGLFTLLALPTQPAAQDNQGQTQHHYRFIDLGTFGGPASYINNDPSGDGAAAGILSPRGIVVGAADTSIPDPNYPNTCLLCGGPLIVHAFRWQGGRLTDLGALPGVNASFANWVSPKGLVAGFSENGAIDPLLVVPEIEAVLWKDGEIVNLGSIEGGYESNAFAVNDRGQVAGVFLNTIPDPFSPFGLQVRAFLWQRGVMEDLGTLGGPEASAYFMNERGEVVGTSFINSIPNSGTGMPTLDPFVWKEGKMIDLGTLGGTFGVPNAMNNRGQVVGESNLVGDLTAHPFLWAGKKMVDLGTFGGDSGQANWINEAGDVVGSAFTKNPQVSLAFLWKNGVLTNLGTVRGDSCSNALSINSKRQVVGVSAKTCDFVTDERHAFLWENNQMIDLNLFLPPNSDLQQLTDAYNINDRGEIDGLGVPPGCGDEFSCGHVFVLIPCDENHPDVEGCDHGPVDADAATRESPASVIHEPMTAAPRTGLDFGRPGLTLGTGHSGMSRRRLGTRSYLSRPAANGGSICEKTSIPSSSYASEKSIPDYHPELRKIHRGGYCSAPGGVLTGYCLGVRAICREAYDPTHCPRGHKAKTPGSFLCSSSGKMPVDLSTSCTP
jgi:probable HAF family extracellular repeat protein